MSTTHICLISGQPMANLLPLLIEKPKQAIFLVSPEMTTQAGRLEKLLHPRGIKVTTREIPAYDFDRVSAICDEIVKETPATATGLTLNVTGGTKIAALAAFQAFYFQNRRIIYLNTSDNQLLQLSPESSSMKIEENHIKTRDYLLAYGMNPLPEAHSAPQRRPGLPELSETLISDDNLLSKLNSAIGNPGKKVTEINLNLNTLGNNAETLADILHTTGAAERTSSTNLHIHNRENIFFCQGGWLEEFVYWSIKDLSIKQLDVAMNVKVEWGGKGKRPTENEFDVLFTHNNRLHIISCKTSNPDPDKKTPRGDKATETLNELDALSDRTGGLFGRAMLVSARKLRDADRERAKKMKIELVDGLNVLRLKERIQSWLTRI